MGEFFGETETEAEREARDLMTEYRDLSDEARQEIRDFVRFKKLQENGDPEHADSDEAEEKP
jgi:hypothetical protein